MVKREYFGVTINRLLLICVLYSFICSNFTMIVYCIS